MMNIKNKEKRSSMGHWAVRKVLLLCSVEDADKLRGPLGRGSAASCSN